MDFTKIQIEKAKACKTLEELKELAKKENLILTDEELNEIFNLTRSGELSDEDLDKVAGGKNEWIPERCYVFREKCPFCGAEFFVRVEKFRNSDNNVKHEWSPTNCGCGAMIKYGGGIVLFEKDGVKRSGIRIIR